MSETVAWTTDASTVSRMSAERSIFAAEKLSISVVPKNVYTPQDDVAMVRFEISALARSITIPSPMNELST